MRSRRLVGLLVATAALASPSPGRADQPPVDPSSAEDALARGVTLRRERKDKEALEAFRQAYALAPSPRALAQIGIAEAALGQWVQAEEDVVRALAEDDPWIARQREALGSALGEIRTHVGAIEVQGPSDAELWIDAAIASRLPAPRIRCAAGRRVVELRAAGSEPARTEVDVPAGQTVRVAFGELARRAEPAKAEAPVNVALPALATREVPPTRTLAWVAAGSAAALLAGGVAATVYTLGRSSTYNDDGACGDLPGLPRSARCASVATEVSTGEVLQAVGYGLAGVATVTSVVLFLTPSPAGPPRASGGCSPSLSGLSCAWSF